MKNLFLLACTLCTVFCSDAQVLFDGNLKQTFSVYAEKAIDVRPDKTYFDKLGKFDSMQNPIWQYDLKPLLFGSIIKVKSDRKGGCLLAGEYSGSLVSKNDTLKPYSNQSVGSDVVLVHYNQNGQKNWWLRFSDYWAAFPTTFYIDKVMDLETDGTYAYLTFHALNKGPWYYVGPDFTDSFQIPNNLVLLKIDMNNGQVVWKKTPNGNATSIAHRDLSVNNKGEIALLYSSQGTLDWGNNVNSTNDGFYVVKIGANGTSSSITKIYNYNTTSSTEDAEVELNEKGEAFFSGRVYGAYPNTVLNLPVNCNYIGKIKIDGGIDWVRKFSALNTYAIDIALHDDHIYFRGDIGKTERFIQKNATDSLGIKADGNNNSSIYFGRFDAQGLLNWHLIGENGSGQTNGVPGILQKLDDGSGVFCVGGFQANSKFGEFSVPTGIGYLEKFILLKTKSSSANASSFTTQPGISFYPNPTTGQIKIESHTNMNACLKNANGSIIQFIQLKQGTNLLSLDLPMGTYFLQTDKYEIAKHPIIILK